MNEENITTYVAPIAEEISIDVLDCVLKASGSGNTKDYSDGGDFD